ncbi:hypothetical protein HGRIS_012975 [Hohenbuehelia grisea]|uniref:3-hydroxyisobutyryl-CoA hydrolase n=1 Tax=Hohenbuehelia grisea TaxID=104357 RepID=A0ABR3ITY5_9AGAR
MLPAALRRMTRLSLATRRTQAVARQLMSTQAPTAASEEVPVVFESKLAVRRYILNRPDKLNALNTPMLELMLPKIEEWNNSDLCGVIVGTGAGRAFCAGGDVAGVVSNAADSNTRHLAVEFFQKEFDLDYFLATLKKPYIAILDGHTMGGGVGLSVHAPFRVATEKTIYSMPETKIGYFPDVGASYFLSKLDGQLGTYLSLTGALVSGRDVFDLGLATHFIPSRRVPMLLDQLSTMENPTQDGINEAIEELSAERESTETPLRLAGPVRAALDTAFSHNAVEKIFKDLETFAIDAEPVVREWAAETLSALQLRSPTSLKVALEAIRRGKSLALVDALNMELRIATAFCSGASPDFATGVKAVLVEKTKARPSWSPNNLDAVTPAIVSKFFDARSPFLQSAPRIAVSQGSSTVRPMQYALPSEETIGAMVRGSHSKGGNTSMKLDELLAKFEDLCGGKKGVKEKVIEVAHRRCNVVDNSDGNFVWLKWKQSEGD